MRRSMISRIGPSRGIRKSLPFFGSATLQTRSPFKVMTSSALIAAASPGRQRRGGVPLEVVSQQRPDRPLDHSVREDLTEFLREKGGGDELGRLGIDGYRLDLGVNAPSKIPSDDRVFALKFLKGEIAGL